MQKKPFPKIHHGFMMKVLERVWLERTFLGVIKAFLEKPTAKLILYKEKLKTIQLTSWISQYYLLLSTISKLCPEYYFEGRNGRFGNWCNYIVISKFKKNVINLCNPYHSNLYKLSSFRKVVEELNKKKKGSGWNTQGDGCWGGCPPESQLRQVPLFHLVLERYVFL